LPSLGLAVRPEAVTEIDEEPAHGLVAQVMSHPDQGVGQGARALAGL
jgi:hypothetical protein